MLNNDVPIVEPSTSEIPADEDTAAATEFYKYAYTSLLNRHVVTSCDAVLDSGESLHRNLETLLNDMRELLYNCTSSELENVKASVAEPSTVINSCAESLSDLLVVLRKYKFHILSSIDRK